MMSITRTESSSSKRELFSQLKNTAELSFDFPLLFEAAACWYWLAFSLIEPKERSLVVPSMHADLLKMIFVHLQNINDFYTAA